MNAKQARLWADLQRIRVQLAKLPVEGFECINQRATVKAGIAQAVAALKRTQDHVRGIGHIIDYERRVTAAMKGWDDEQEG